MTHTFTTTGDIGPDHQMLIKLPSELPAGPVRVTITVESKNQAQSDRLGDLLNFDSSSMWPEISEEADVAEFSRGLRERAWRRAQP